ncbi:MAG: hypothetical protein ACK4YQ_06520 [Phenylobacterium sp.]|uniref:hypothetical protein n=1 Tax=Phenylobacterium sp. TaxID=1871053 RepID=UPI003918A8A6
MLSPRDPAAPGEARAGQALAASAYRWVLWGGFLVMLGANLPGHLSFDSVVQLHEARTGVRETWAPAVMSWILRRFDDLSPGAGLYVTASALLLFASLLALRGLRPRTSWAAPAAALAAAATPMLLIYPAIVWKDVLFADLAVAGFVALAYAARGWADRRGRLAPLGAALAALSLAALVRQNGAVALAVAALVVGWTARGGGARAMLGWGLGFLAAGLVLSQAIGVAAQPQGAPAAKDTRIGLRVLQHYDIVGAVAHEPSLPLEALSAEAPAAAAVVRAQGPVAYSPVRVETFDRAPELGRALWKTPEGAVARQWREIVLGHPGAYLSHRLEVFRWVFLTPALDQCLPVFTGVADVPGKLADLQIAAGQRPQDRALADYAARFFDTPVYSHLAYALLALAVGVFLLWRGEAADLAIAGLQAAALGFAASFLLISVACDYRYLYFLDVAAMAGFLYVALDPSLIRRRRRAG